MKTQLLNAESVAKHACMQDVVPAVEEVFAAYEQDRAQMPPKSYIDLPQYNGDFRSMPAYVETEKWDAAAIKWVNVHPNNPSQFELPTVMGTVVYTDPENGFPLAILDGTELTRIRTGAAAAVATDHLAVKNASSMGIVGAGVQSYTQLEAVAEVRPIDRVIVSDVDPAMTEQFVERFEGRFEVEVGDVGDAAQCDVLSTVTPVESPVISVDDIGETTHINAIGADATGKHEIDDEILLRAKLVIDDHEQTTHSGEINVPYHNEILTDGDIHAEVGEVVVGQKEGRTSTDGVTVFDSTGLAIQDVAAAHVAYQNAIKSSDIMSYKMVDAHI